MSIDTSRTDDELAIRNLIAELAWQADHAPANKLDTYLGCFTEDAVLTVTNTDHANVCTGIEAIKQVAVERRKIGISGPGSQTFHFIGPTIIEFTEDDQAKGRSYLQVQSTKGDTPTTQMLGQYEDLFKLTPNGWKLSKRDVTFY